MTLSVPSAFAAVTRASMPPRSSADVAVAASDPLPPLEPPSPDPQAVRVSPAVTTATAVRRMLRRTCPPVVVPRRARAPVTTDGPAPRLWPTAVVEGRLAHANVW